jgi:cell wall assembly regulator SMI1
MLNAIAAIEAKLESVLTSNLKTILVELDKQIEAERKIAQASSDFSQMQALNITWTAVINVLDEREPDFFDAYCAAKYEVTA